ncbi:DUF3784 domain-containing protein [Planomicrobium sp. YIM 101495]|nr:DUF3784 domain-containing protein [Planomicrobium sp. YIM 101495]
MNSLAELIPLLIITLLFFILSIYLLQGKGGFLIAGYNTMPEDEKKNYDEAALCRAMGKMMMAITGCLFIFMIGSIIDAEWPFVIGSILMVAVIVVGLIYMRGGQRYKKN